MAILDTSKSVSPAASDAMTPAQWDAYWVTDWLASEAYNEVPPPSADPDLDYAHENPEAWPLVELPSELDGKSAWLLMESAAQLDVAVPRHLKGKHDQKTHGHGHGKLAAKPHYTGTTPTHLGAPDPGSGNYPGYDSYLKKKFGGYEKITAPKMDEVPKVMADTFDQLPPVDDTVDMGDVAEGQFDAAIKQATEAKRRHRKLITEDEARGNSRAVSEEEFHLIADQGDAMLAQRFKNRAPIHPLDDERSWKNIKDDAYAESLKSWGGATIDSHTGRALPQGANRYAITVKPVGVETVSIREHPTPQEFHAAMDTAKHRFRSQLENEGSHLGVFHDDENKRIDIDPVVVVDSLHEVEAIGAATYAIGGAYHFQSGDGFWPPHIVDKGERARRVGPGNQVHWQGPGEWLSYANEVQNRTG